MNRWGKKWKTADPDESLVQLFLDKLTLLQVKSIRSIETIQHFWYKTGFDLICIQHINISNEIQSRSLFFFRSLKRRASFRARYMSMIILNSL